jgi:hypothetical protein
MKGDDVASAQGQAKAAVDAFRETFPKT